MAQFSSRNLPNTEESLLNCTDNVSSSPNEELTEVGIYSIVERSWIYHNRCFAWELFRAKSVSQISEPANCFQQHSGEFVYRRRLTSDSLDS